MPLRLLRSASAVARVRDPLNASLWIAFAPLAEEAWGRVEGAYRNMPLWRCRLRNMFRTGWRALGDLIIRFVCVMLFGSAHERCDQAKLRVPWQSSPEYCAQYDGRAAAAAADDEREDASACTG